MLKLSTMTGKLSGFQSLNVDTTSNTFCQSMQEKAVEVCQHCYSQKSLTTYRQNAVPMYSKNMEVLRLPHPMPEILVPAINQAMFRLFSHGDVENENMARNVLQIIRENPWCSFTAWSKNKSAWNAAIKQDGKPDNLILVFSNPSMKRVMSKPPQGWDKVFNVTANKDDKRINCNSACMDCKLCYTKNDTACIVEPLKKGTEKPITFRRQNVQTTNARRA